MRYIKEFANATALQAAVDNGELGRPYLCYLQDQSKIAWDSEQPGPHDYSKDYLTFRVTGNGNIRINCGVSNKHTISYSKDNGNTWETTKKSKTVNVLSGDVVMFKCDKNDASSLNFTGCTCQFEIEGNMMSMVYGDNFSGQTTFKYDKEFWYMFSGCTGLTSAENLVLPATTLKDGCYQNMFEGCTSLTTAPELPATTLVDYCYYKMFYGCSKLNYIKCLATNGTASPFTNTGEWVRGVSSTGTFVKKAGASWRIANNGIPSGWTVIEE